MDEIIKLENISPKEAIKRGFDRAYSRAVEEMDRQDLTGSMVGFESLSGATLSDEALEFHIDVIIKVTVKEKTKSAGH